MRRLFVLALMMCLVSSQPAEARRLRHTVEAGQTLWSIAVAYRVTVEALMAANGIDDPNRLEVGQILRIPAARAIKARVAPTRSHSRDGVGLDWPLKGRITSRYGRRGRRHHNGLDIAATKGTIIVAAASGRVIRDGGRWGRYGRVVLVEHDDGVKTLYAHLSRSFVSKSQVVEAGQAIGAVGATGNATGPHLHFEVWRGDKTVDPLRVLPPSDERLASLR